MNTWAVRLEGTTEVEHYNGAARADDVAQQWAAQHPGHIVFAWDVTDESVPPTCYRADRDGGVVRRLERM